MNEPWRIIEGDALAVLRTLGEGAFQTCACSPPYWQLRSYLGCVCHHPLSRHEGRGPCSECPCAAYVEHPDKHLELGAERTPDCFAWARGAPGSCGACYVCKMTCVFREVRRVLRPDGTLWVNVAGSYNSAASNRNGLDGSGLKRNVRDEASRQRCLAENKVYRSERTREIADGWKPKDYVNVPALLAESLRADGWFLRAEVALTKVAPMPEPCRDRPTRATEKLYLFAKRGAYFYDQEAERTEHQPSSIARVLCPSGGGIGTGGTFHHNGPEMRLVVGQNVERPACNPAGRNLWDWWDSDDSDLPPAVWPWRPDPQKRGSKHYATYPLWLPLRCVRLGTSAKGCCPRCSAPWRRVVEKPFKGDGNPHGSDPAQRMEKGNKMRMSGEQLAAWNAANPPQPLGWAQSCKCPPHEPRPCAVLDIFCGTGTTGVAARLLGRTFTGIELSSAYAQVARERLASACPLDDAAFARTPSPQPSPGLFDGGSQ